MAEAKKLGGAGLRGQVAGETALCTVGKTGTGLTYRGYDITDLADNAQFEEVAYLLLRGKLPNQAELDAYKTKLKSLRNLPEALKLVLEQIPKDAHPMDVMRTGCSMLGNLETEQDFSEQDDKIDRMLGCSRPSSPTGTALPTKAFALIPPIPNAIPLVACSWSSCMARSPASCMSG
tara:strand:+ start:488 stop:1018 length:531 start_codon:yes stop_codon:yes gene_type:complete